MIWEDLNKLTRWMYGFQYLCRCGRGKELLHISELVEKKKQNKGNGHFISFVFYGHTVDSCHWRSTCLELVDSHGLLFPPPFPMFGVNSAAQPKKNPTLPPVLLCGQLSLQSCAESFSTCFSDCLASWRKGVLKETDETWPPAEIGNSCAAGGFLFPIIGGRCNNR